MGKRADLFDRIAAVESEFASLRLAAERLARDARSEPAVLRTSKLEPRHIREARKNLEATYLIRVFAVAEAGLRDVWLHKLGRHTYPPAKDLLDAMATRFRVPPPWLREVHEVREYRNALVHEGESEAAALSLRAAIQRLKRIVSRLPLDW